MKNYRKILTAFILSFQFLSLKAAETLNNLNTNWSIVMPGKVMVEPAVTSYGFSVITDSKLLSTYSSNGILLWETTVPRYRDAKIYVLADDFILLSTEKNSKLTLLNPSGVELWNKELDFQVTSNPLSGRDGRFFVCGNDEIECLGITGITKWKLNTENLSQVPVQSLPDGSIVAFLSKTQDGKTKGIRISPFGEIMEEILFSGQVVSASTHTEGIALTFTDGSAGYFTLEENQSRNKWVLQNNGAGGNGTIQPGKCQFLILDDSSVPYIFYMQAFTRSVNIYKVNPKDGQVISSFRIDNIDTSNISQLYYTKSGIFICDSKTGWFYNDSGIELWSAVLPDKKGKTEWNYLIYTFDNHFIICNTNWTLNCYRVSQATKNRTVTKQNLNYSNWYKIDTTDFEYIFREKIEGDVVSPQRLSELKKGNYEKEEIVYISQLLSACQVLRTVLSSNNKTNWDGLSIFDKDSIGTEQLLNQLHLYSTDTFNSYEAFFLQKITNKSLLITLLKGIAENGYDPDGSVLSALQILAKKTSYKDELILTNICDAVYSVCNFMGRPAYNSKGKEILQNFLFPNFNSTTRTYARETLKKISALDL